jgi:hypothetical protein
MAGPADRPAAAGRLEPAGCTLSAYTPADQVDAKEAAKAAAAEEARALTAQIATAAPHHQAEPHRPEASRLTGSGQADVQPRERGQTGASPPRRNREQMGGVQLQRIHPREAANQPSRTPPRQRRRKTEPETEA